MEVARMNAEVRTSIGRNQTKHLRRVGWLPAIVYGEGQNPQAISISEWEFEQHIKHHHKVYSLEIDGSHQDAYLQALQFDALTDRPQHVDFKRIDLDKPIEVDMEVTFIGHPVGLGKGGVLIKDNASLRIRCLPTEIPDSLEAAIGHMELNDFLTAKEVPLPQGVELASNPATPMCRVSMASKAPEATDEEPAEQQPPAEGEDESQPPAKPKE